MPPFVASLVFALGVCGLFVLDRDREVRTSKALWIPVIWLWIAGSRAVSEWLGIMGWGPKVTNAAAMYIDGSPIDRNVLTALLVLGLIVLVRRKRFGRLLRANAPILLFFLYAAISTLWSDYPEVTIKRWFKDVGDLVMVMVVLTDPDWISAIKRVLVRSGFLLIPHSVLLIKYYPAIGRMYNRWTWMASYTGVTTHKNLLGRVCLVFGIAFAWCFLTAYRDRGTKYRSRHLIAHGAAIAMVVWLFVMANSVTAQSCCILAVAFLIVSGSRALEQKRWVVHLLVLALVVVPLSSVLLGFGGEALEQMGRDSTLTGRTVIWDLLLREAGNPLVGIGFESFWLGDRLTRIQNIHQGLNESHNGYLEIFLTLGWIGVLLLAAVIVTGYRNIMASFGRNPNVARLGMALFISEVVLSFTEAGFRMLNINWITFLLAIMIVPEDRRPENRPALKLAPTSERTHLETESVALVGILRQSSPSADHAVGAGWPTLPPPLLAGAGIQSAELLRWTAGSTGRWVADGTTSTQIPKGL